MERGTILQATHRALTQGFHYIVYFEGNPDQDFIGGMITHYNGNGNVPMQPEYFEINDKNDKAFKVTYDNSFLVVGKFIKPSQWGPYSKVGKLSEEGIQFLENIIGNLPFEPFAYYYKRNQK
ncbi:hypothetical protein ASE21_09940 [Flavobacterium sp. Root901]|uniref:hypothetical protein n=1 Tax=Flavobacterium sp. Root901 TaxID=1736605 RepID=UPI00071047F4|nr:hypothetical protein [Flavobacterium sp. Root901]KRD10034.1 hypothetical protein ASE21_09940 [Flavobacterium sp. Root901]